MTTKTRIADFADKLIAEGEGVLNTEFKAAGNWGGSPPRYVDLQKFKKWRSSCNLLLTLMGELSAPWKEVLGGDVANDLGNAMSTQGALESIRDAIAEDLLVRFEDLVFAEAFSDLVDQAEYLFAQGYILASGVILRAVLEERLSRMCVRNSCLPQKQKPTIADYNTELYKKSIYDKITLKHVEAMAAVGNDAAHNNPALDKADVARFNRDLVAFLEKYAS